MNATKTEKMNSKLNLNCLNELKIFSNKVDQYLKQLKCKTNETFAEKFWALVETVHEYRNIRRTDFKYDFFVFIYTSRLICYEECPWNSSNLAVMNNDYRTLKQILSV